MRVVRRVAIGRGYKCELVHIPPTHLIYRECMHSYQLFMITPNNQRSIYGHLKRQSNSFKVIIQQHMMLRKHRISDEALQFANSAVELASVDAIFTL